MGDALPDRLIIVGPGLLGASLGLALGARVPGRVRRVGVARRPETLEVARRRGAIDAGAGSIAEALEAGAPGRRLLVLATPLGTFPELMREVARHGDPSLVVTDVGSTKLGVVEAARAHLPEPSRFVPAHPMAGSERRGPEGARAELFAGKPCILCPGEATDPEALACVEALWRTVGMSLLRMSARDHDRRTALTSHLPHVAAVLLARVAREEGGLEVASTGFRDTTRLASSNPPMRADILVANRGPVLEALDAFERELAALRRELEMGDEAALLERLESARALRDGWVNEADSRAGSGAR